MSRGLGRRVAEDPRDRGFLMRVPTSSPLRWRYWYDNSWWGDQGWTSQCVAYAWTHFIEDSPITHPEPGSIVNPAEVYREAQKIDEWPGEDYDGTSVRAGAKVLRERGLIGSFVWAFDLQTVVTALLEHGPVVVGTNWYESMFDPFEGRDALGDRRVMIDISVGSEIAGGHAYVLNGVNVDRRTVRMKNSWGRSWGVDGRASMSFDTLDRLISESGEACMATEIIETP